MKTQYKMQTDCLLYRYDLNKPPKEWDIEHKNPEYIINGKSKNVADLFFFFENKFVTYMTADKAMSNKYTEFWLTKTKIKESLNLLDLRGGGTIAMLNTLFYNGINIFVDDMYIQNCNEEIKFSDLKEDFDYFMSDFRFEYNLVKIQASFNRVNSYFIAPGCPFSLLGQILTDGDNGIVFKQKLIKAGYDGYIFDESLDGSTICLINTDKLSSPQVECIDKAQLFKYKKRKIYGIQD